MDSMKNKLLMLILLIVCQSAVFAQNANWNCFETENFIVHYPGGYDLEATEALYYLEYHRDEVIELTGHDPGKIHVYIMDEGMYSNGWNSPGFVDTS